MPKRLPPLVCSERERETVERLSHSRTDEARLVLRARIIVGCVKGESIARIAERLEVMPNTVVKWRRRFVRDGVAGLRDRPRPGKSKKYGTEFRSSVLKVLEERPPAGQACWDGPAVARRLNVPAHAVWRLLRREGICLSRQRSWCVSTDPEFAPKAADIIGLYLDPPQNALVLAVDEKPSIQALERATGYVQTSDGKIVRGFRSTYKRHGTLNLFAALTVATGAIHAKTAARKRRVEFLEFMNEVVSDLPAEREVHVILDNYCIHKKNDGWLAAHPNVHFHYTPTSASWLNLVEIWFGIFTRKALRGASFQGTAELSEAIAAYITAYGPQAKPFVWRKREVKGSQLRNTITNLCN
jgi:transposase